MQKKLILSIVVFIIIFVILFSGFDQLVRLKKAYTKTDDFFSQEEEFDVLFFGTSHVMNGIYPMELWKKYGIVSYNLGKPGETLTTTYYNIKLALKQHKPKIICVDTSMFFEEKVNSNKSYVHYSMDSYPISIEKYLAIKDLYGEDLLNNEIEYLLNFSLYHSRWNNIDKEDFINKKDYEKGASMMTQVATSVKKNDFNNDGIYNSDNVNMQYLINIIELCKENNIEILITYLPQTKTDSCISNAQYIKQICDKYNTNYINFLDSDIVNDTDFYNMLENNAHLNCSGARKVTNYLGNYIKENYNVKDNRNDPNYNFWKEDYNNYIDFKISKLIENEKNLNSYLSLLYGEEDLEYEINISSKQKIEKGSLLKELLENLNNNYTINDEVFKGKNNKKIKITIYDNKSKNKIQEVWF